MVGLAWLGFCPHPSHSCLSSGKVGGGPGGLTPLGIAQFQACPPPPPPGAAAHAELRRPLCLCELGDCGLPCSPGRWGCGPAHARPGAAVLRPRGGTEAQPEALWETLTLPPSSLTHGCHALHRCFYNRAPETRVSEGHTSPPPLGVNRGPHSWRQDPRPQDEVWWLSTVGARPSSSRRFTEQNPKAPRPLRLNSTKRAHSHPRLSGPFFPIPAVPPAPHPLGSGPRLPRRPTLPCQHTQGGTDRQHLSGSPLLILFSPGPHDTRHPGGLCETHCLRDGSLLSPHHPGPPARLLCSAPGPFQPTHIPRGRPLRTGPAPPISSGVLSLVIRAHHRRQENH